MLEIYYIFQEELDIYFVDDIDEDRIWRQYIYYFGLSIF